MEERELCKKIKQYSIRSQHKCITHRKKNKKPYELNFNLKIRYICYI